MRVLFISRATLYDSPGGDTIQILKTAEYLRKLDIQVDIGLCNQKFDYESYDVVHFFNIIRPGDIIYHLKRVSKSVISTIYVDYSETEKYTANFFRSFLIKALGSDRIEYLKAVAKHLLGKERIISKEYIYWGHKKSIKYILSRVQAVLPNSLSELTRLDDKYKIPDKILKLKIVNAIEITSNEAIPNMEYNGAVICVGRIERRKNQLNFIRAMKNSNIACYIIGKPSINDLAYYEMCRSEAGENFHFVDHLPQKEIYNIMKSATVHVLPSWFETTGLVSLEAAYLGCNIVISEKGDQKEYFEDYAFYCKPDDVNSIKDAIKKALEAPYNKSFREKIQKYYTWDNTALQTKEAYEKVLEISY